MAGDAARMLTGSLFAVAMLAAGTATAADKTLSRTEFSSRFELEATPYFWMAGLSGTLQLAPALPAITVDESFDDIFHDLTGTFATVVTLRRDRIALSADFFYVATATPIDVGALPFVSGTLDHSVFFTTVTAGYRALESDIGSFDLLAGLRAWWFDSDLTLTSANPVLSIAAQRSESWVDPIVGASGRVNLGARAYLTGYADIGGFTGPSDLTWQFAGTLGYTLKDCLDLSAGYRIVHVEHDSGGVTRDVDYAGPILTATLRF